MEEPDEEWNYDLLLQHLSQEMQAEADEAKRRKQEAAAEGEGASPAGGAAVSGKRVSPAATGKGAEEEGGAFAAAGASAPGASVAIAGRRK